MIRNRLDRFLASRVVVPLSLATSLLFGLVFIFVWAPHPWGRFGIDQYHQLAIELAQGRTFSTIDVPWGYAYFLSLFYRIFGPNPVPPLLAQAALNAAIPGLIYRYARDAFGSRVAAVAALLTALLSFNTIYASTESSDAVCTVLFVAMVVLFAMALRRNRWLWFAACGAIAGIAAQFRPNLILVPVLLAIFTIVSGPRDSCRVRNGALVLIAAVVMLSPWTLRNLQLTAQFIPTSTHAGMQLWYGTLQTGPYLDARQYNPRSVFETPVFDYSSLLNSSILLEGTPNCLAGTPASLSVVYWTDASTTPQRISLEPVANDRYLGEIPAQFQTRTIYYYFEIGWPSTAGPHQRYTPEAGPADPFVYFLSSEHLGDLDTHDGLLDIFDLARLLRHIAWDEPVRATVKVDLDRSGRLDESDFRAAVSVMLSGLTDAGQHGREVSDVLVSSSAVRARFVDGSNLIVPRSWNGLVTDLQIGQGLALGLVHAVHRFTQPKTSGNVPVDAACLGLINLSVNRPFYRRQPHEMRRYTALAWDNIRRDPGGYASSVLYRALRLFIIRGTEDRNSAVQFADSRLLYRAASAASAAYFALFLIGAFVGWRRGYPIALPLALIVYIPATIAFVLTNMRYTITVQPFMFVFVAVSLVAMLEQVGALPPVPRGAAAAQNPSGSRTTLRP